MTKLDFSAVKDARVGEREIHRIYRGDAKVWNRYCWEKWSCSIVNAYTLNGNATGESVEVVNPDRSTGSLGLYKTRTGKVSSGYYEFSGKIPSNTYTYSEAYSKGYVYLPYDGTTASVGETYLKATGYTYDSDGKKSLVFKEYEVVRSIKFSGYAKGTTSYGIVEGFAGDYPDDGRHSDGYWYVRVDPVGVKEE